MLIKTPQFWQKRNFLAYLFLPLSLVYMLAAGLKNKLHCARKIKKPVICIGNLTVGGSGKTPTALMVGEVLKEMNKEFVYLTRGYKSKKSSFGIINKDVAKAQDVGDEPLLLAEIAPTFVAKDRLKGALEIEKMLNISAIVMDDGMQNNALQKDFLILVIDEKIKFGNKFLFPAGPLRERLKQGLAKANLVIVVGEIDDELRQILAANKVIQAQIKVKNAPEFKASKLIAFCGLAYPQKFFSLLENQGFDVIATKAFADHYFYDNIELDQMLEIAQRKGAKLITTKKDWVKFAPYYKEKIKYLDIELSPENKGLLINELQKITRLSP